MRNGLVQLGAWTAATGAAVALSWLGVHAVLTDAAFEQPSALPLPSAAVRTSDAPSVPVSPPASTPAPTTSPASPTPAAATTPVAKVSKKPTATAGTASVKSFRVPGGRVALDMQPTTAELVSATPDQGWQMQLWQGDQWLRVDFTKDGSTNSVFATWNGHHPDVQTVVR
ncbi:cytoskeletal protein RodZ [Kitasatospora gansuensis]|uniref:Cytoskeletal protein RodZ n=1 Tax=Kitasatospora gansuensis TaxID=258050 RepID=A0A7W7WJ82_9ACTN|nr:hypothetical protein [Kitasatospora gansuensis]MBB4949051.1 cytoskeletal protein RodZ [Kitasatospora gansuensis]